MRASRWPAATLGSGSDERGRKLDTGTLVVVVVVVVNVLAVAMLARLGSLRRRRELSRVAR